MKPPFASAVLLLCLALTACSGGKTPHAAPSPPGWAAGPGESDDCGSSTGKPLPADMSKDPSQFSLEIEDLVAGRITVDQAIEYSMLSQFKGSGPKVPDRYAHPAHGTDVVYSATLLLPWASAKTCA